MSCKSNRKCSILVVHYGVRETPRHFNMLSVERLYLPPIAVTWDIVNYLVKEALSSMSKSSIVLQVFSDIIPNNRTLNASTGNLCWYHLMIYIVFNRERIKHMTRITNIAWWWHRQSWFGKLSQNMHQWHKRRYSVSMENLFYGYDYQLLPINEQPDRNHIEIFEHVALRYCRRQCLDTSLERCAICINI